MIFIKDKWTSKNYQEFIDYLKDNSDSKYKVFHSKLLKNEKIKLIGIRTPNLKRIAKEISKGNYMEFISNIKHEYYEEDIIYGLILGYIKVDFNKLIKFLNTFTKYIDNWATNDLVCANLKVFKNNQEEGYKYIIILLNSKNTWEIRFGIVLLLDFYINDNFIDRIIDISGDIKSKDYYVQMANSWLISMCYIKYPENTKKLLESSKLDDFTLNKSIQKIIESYRISIEDKNNLRKLKRHL